MHSSVLSSNGKNTRLPLSTQLCTPVDSLSIEFVLWSIYLTPASLLAGYQKNVCFDDGDPAQQLVGPAQNLLEKSDRTSFGRTTEVNLLGLAYL